MKKLIIVFIIVIVAVAAWSYFGVPPVAVVELPSADGAPIRAALAVNPELPQAGEETVLTFSFTNEDGTPTVDLMQHHTRKVHVVLVGEDRATLGHVHPEDFSALNDGLSSGTYKVAYTFPTAGRYIVAVDVANTEGSLAKQFIVNVEGDSRMGAPAASLPTKACFTSVLQETTDRYTKAIDFSEATAVCPDGYEVSFMPPQDIRAGIPTQLSFTVEKDGQPVTDLTPVMSAGVHFAILPETFDLIMHRHGGPGEISIAEHSHEDGVEEDDHDETLPNSFGPNLVSEEIVFPKEGSYTLFLQFKRGQELIFGRFMVEVGEGVSATGETKMLMIPLVDGKLTAGSGVWTVSQGDMVMFHVMADGAEELHVHGYDETLEFPAGKETTLTFFADTAGRFPIELEGLKKEIGVLEVLPR